MPDGPTRDALLDPPAGAPAWVPRIDDERSISRLRRGVLVVLVLGLAAFVVRGADRPDDPAQVQPSAQAMSEAPTGSAPPGTPPGDPGRVPLEGFGEVAIAVTDDDGAVVGWCVLLADTEKRRQKGLMGVETLRGYPGMLFVFEGDRKNAFWMRNTPMPLSIAFFDGDGSFVSSTDMVPCGDDPNCPLYPAEAPYRYALEVPLGRLDDLGVRPGSKLGVYAECAPRGTG